MPRKKRFAARTDSGESFTVTPDIAAVYGLRVGVTLSRVRLHELLGQQAREDAMSAALRLVACRQRSERELRDRLFRRGTPAPVVDVTMARLKELRLIDDAAFAATWVESRDRASPRSRRLLASELRLKGVTREVAATSLDAVDDADAAYRAGLKRARLLAGKPFEEFRRKVGDLLLRRGFDYETAREAVRRLWDEATAAAEELR